MGMLKSFTDKSIYFGLLLLLGGLAAVFFWYSTPHSLALVNDSVQYIDGARNLLLGNGYSRATGWGTPIAITNFPPFYSIVLAFAMLLGIETVQATWWISLLFLCINVALGAEFGRRLTRSTAFGILSGFFLLISDPFFRHHLFALTEPVFLFCYWMALLLLVIFLEKRHGWIAALAGVFAGLAYLTRYIGVTLLVTGILVLLVFLPGWKERFKSMVCFLAGAAPLFLGWTVRNQLVTGNPLNRQLMLRSLAPDKIHEGIASFWGWLLPEPYQIIERFINLWGVLLVVFLLVYLTGTVGAWMLAFRRKELRSNPSFRLGWILALQGLVYLALLAFTILFVDASVNFETRILMPVFNLLLLLFVAFLAWLWQRRAAYARILTLFLVLALAISFAEDTLDTVRQWRVQGQGFAHESWSNSQTIELVNKLTEVEIYTNRPQAITLLASRGAYISLSPINPATQQPRPDYLAEQARIRSQVLEGKAVLVLFGYQDLIQDEDNSWIVELTNDLPVLLEYEKDVVFGMVDVR